MRCAGRYGGSLYSSRDLGMGAIHGYNLTSEKSEREFRVHHTQLPNQRTQLSMVYPEPRVRPFNLIGFII